MEIREYTSKHQPKEIIQELLDKNQNYHLVKDRTGSGATFGVFDITNKKIILVSPTKKLVIDKEEELYKHPNTIGKFYYESSNDKISKANPSEYPEVIMGTIDMVAKLKLQDYFDAGYHIIFDELHMIIKDSKYRSVISSNFENIIDIFNGRVLTLTATPLDIYPKQMRGYNIMRLVNPTFGSKKLGYTFDKKTFETHLNNCITPNEDGSMNDILIFSNSSSDLIKYLTHYHKEYNVKSLLGSTLTNKVEIHKYVPKDFVIGKPNMVIGSSASMEGINIMLNNPHVFIINHYKSGYGFFTTQNIVQALGRVRSGYNTALLFNDKGGIMKTKEYTKDELANEVIKCSIDNTELQKKLFIPTDDSKLKIKFSEDNYEYVKMVFSAETINKVILSKKNITLGEMLYNISKIENFDKVLMDVTRNIHVSNTYYGYTPKVSLAVLLYDYITLTLNFNPVDLIGEYCSKNFDKDVRKMLNSLKQFGLVPTHKFNKKGENLTKGKNDLLGEYALIYSKKSENPPINDKNDTNLPYGLLDRITNIIYLFHYTHPTNSVINSLQVYAENKYINGDGIELKFNLEYLLKFIVNEIKKLSIKKKKGELSDYDENYNAILIKLEAVIENSEDKDLKYLTYVEIISKFAQRNYSDEKLGKRMYPIYQYQNQNINLGELLGNTNIDADILISKEWLNDIKDYIIKEAVKDLKTKMKRFGAEYIRNFDTTTKSVYREFNSVTMLPMTVIGFASPFGAIEMDFTRASVTIINAFLGIKDFDVYQVIQDKLRVSRDRAKEMFATNLNKHTSDNGLRRAFFNNIYNPTEVDKLLSQYDKGGKSTLYLLTNKIEEVLINNLKKELNKNIDITDESLPPLVMRRHDSVVVFDKNFDVSGITSTKTTIIGDGETHPLEMFLHINIFK